MKITKVAQFFSTVLHTKVDVCISFDTKWYGPDFWAIFSQTHRVTLIDFNSWIGWASGACTRVARLTVFKPKLPIWVNFIVPCNGSCWSILRQFGIFCGHLVYFIVIEYIFRVLVCCTKKNLATLACTRRAPLTTPARGKLDSSSGLATHKRR
jgi:hypothetical protein